MYNFYIYHKEIGRIRIEDPVGWDGLGKKIIRDSKLHGVFFEYTPKLQFIKKGKAIIHNFLEKYGIEVELYLIVTFQDPVTRIFSTDYTGRFNMTTLEISELYATCNVENTGFLQKFKNRMDVKVNLQSLISQGGVTLSPYDSETQNILLHSKSIKKVLDVASTNQEYYEDAINVLNAGLNATTFIKVGFDVINQDEIEDTFMNFGPSELDPVENSLYLMKLKEAGSYNVDIKLDFEVEYIDGALDLITHYFQVFFGIKDGLTLIHNETTPKAFFSEEVMNLNEPPNAVGEFRKRKKTYTVNYQHTFNFTAGQEVYLHAFSDVDYEGESGGDWIYRQKITLKDTSYMRIDSATSFPSTISPVVLIHEAWSRVCQSITDQEDSFRSDYYGRTDSEPRQYSVDGEGSLRGQTDGALLRGFPLKDNPMHTSFKEMFEGCNAIDSIGVGIDKEGTKQVIRVEPVSHFYSKERSIILNWVNDIRKKVDATRFYNEIKAGYKKWANEEYNNLDEFLSRRELTLPITQVKNSLDLISPFIAGGYTLEFTRRDRYKDATTKDNENDNETFIIELRRTAGGFEPARNQDFTMLDNILDPNTVYNANLSISRNLIRNGAIIAASLIKSEEGIKMSFGEGNTRVLSQKTGEDLIIESGEITKEQLGKAIWRNEIYLFKHRLSLMQWRTINQHPTKYIEFSPTDRNHKKGYILEAVPDQRTREVSFTLLRANL
ncbi:hypothetical protein JMN32_19865 [Fulvivirga sp. 29W222]|uniref:Uncharacterized protein n=1 Tax=Fulvivirga marina TaxID=2494733 RepID=A0A937KFW2_9BACT|nr:hypothetical protein [Fulvivirga marina]MBL6448578.1 hypothetical protein [Fulvivirga marina]